MKALTNVPTAADYPAQLGNGCSIGTTSYPGTLGLQIYNATAYVQLYVKDDPQNATSGYHPLQEIALTPQSVTFQGVIGVALRDFTSGTHATVFATLTEVGDPIGSGATPLTGTASGGQITPVATNPAGVILGYGGAAAPSGYVLCDGSAYDGTTTTYSALWSAIGAAYGGVQAAFNVPDLRGRSLVGLGTNADVNALSDNDGVALANRSPRHNTTNALTLPNHVHSVTDPGHTHDVQVRTATAGALTEIDRVANASTVQTLAAKALSALTGLTIGNPTTNPSIGGSIGPGGTLPIDLPAYAVANYIISLG